MPRIFLESSKINKKKCAITGDDYYHLKKVRRIKIGDHIDICTDDGKTHIAEIIKIDSNALHTEILESNGIKDDPIELTICLSLLKGKSFDTVIRKSAEIGVAKIIPVITERTIPEISQKKKSKTERWQKIAFEASKQSFRNCVPIVKEVSLFNDIITNISSSIKIIAHTDKNSLNIREYLAINKKEKDAAILIGPEGGFSEKELNAAKRHGWQDLRFGYSCLRAETAAIVLPAIIIYEWSIDNEVIC